MKPVLSKCEYIHECFYFLSVLTTTIVYTPTSLSTISKLFAFKLHLGVFDPLSKKANKKGLIFSVLVVYTKHGIIKHPCYRNCVYFYTAQKVLAKHIKE